MTLLSFVAGLLATAAISTVHAQTWTKCQPLNVTCPPDPALGTTHTWNFSMNSYLDSTWNITNGAVSYTNNAMEFSIQKTMDSPTIQSTFYLFFGRVEYHVQSAPGQGVISSVVLQSDDLDEIDWEWVGKYPTQVQSNYYGKGVTQNGTGMTHNLTVDASAGYHNYTTWWDQNKLQWWVDGQLLRTLTYDEATGGANYPQTPMTVRIGIWPAGDPSQPIGRIEWAGGEIDYTKGPYNMYISQLTAQDFGSGKEYVYGDHSGAWQSINQVAGNSTASQSLNVVHLSLAQKWNQLPTAAKIGIYAGAGGAVAIGLMVLLFCCIRQRRIGRREFNVQNNQFLAERTEMMNMQAEWRQKGYVDVKG